MREALIDEKLIATAIGFVSRGAPPDRNSVLIRRFLSIRIVQAVAWSRVARATLHCRIEPHRWILL
jgi:hypothetical protein